MASFFRPGYADVAPAFLDDVMRTDGRASGPRRQHRAEWLSRRGRRGRRSESPAGDRSTARRNNWSTAAYFNSLTTPTLWRGAVQIIPDAGHAPQWETPAFDALLEAFITEMA